MVCDSVSLGDRLRRRAVQPARRTLWASLYGRNTAQHVPLTPRRPTKPRRNGCGSTRFGGVRETGEVPSLIVTATVARFAVTPGPGGVVTQRESSGPPL